VEARCRESLLRADQAVALRTRLPRGEEFIERCAVAQEPTGGLQQRPAKMSDPAAQGRTGRARESTACTESLGKRQGMGTHTMRTVQSRRSESQNCGSGRLSSGAATDLADTSPGCWLRTPLVGIVDDAANLCQRRDLPNPCSHLASRRIPTMLVF